MSRKNINKISINTFIEHIFSHIFNISKHEIFRVVIAWIFKFLLHTITVLGFTVTLALFVGEMGIENLPLLFIFQALFAIGGTFLLSNYLKSFSKSKSLMIGAGILSFLSFISFFIHETSTLLFFTFLIIIYSVIITQMNIALSLFIEELFSPLESERAFPIIESAEPIGGIFAGLITGIGIQLSFFGAIDFLFVLTFFGGIFIPITYFFLQKLNPIPKPHSKKDEFDRLGVLEEMKTSFQYLVKNPFLKAMFLSVIVQWVVYNLIEFQYTTALTHEFTDSHHESGDSVANQLTHGLGLIHIIIHGGVLFFQLFFASKIIKKLGVVRTILLHPTSVFFASLGMIFSFSFFTATGTKAVFEIFGGLARNAYHSSFYVFRPHVRERAKEFLEGIARPFGLLIGTVIIFLLQILSAEIGIHLTELISFVLIFFIAWRIITSFKLGQKYTLLARKNLETGGHAPEKLDAIEILAQKGHINPTVSLLKVLNFKNEKPEVKIKILKTLGELRDENTIPEIVNCFFEKNSDLQIAAVASLAEFKDLGSHFLGQSFAKHRVIEALKDIFKHSRSKKLKAEVIRVFQNIKHPDIVPFLLESLEEKDPVTIAGAIKVCGMFHDISSAYYLEKFLIHSDPVVKSNTIIALWQFVPYRMRLTMILAGMLETEEKELLLSGIYTAGTIQAIQELPRIIHIFHAYKDDIEIRRHAAIALAKMGHEPAIEHILDLLLHPKKDIARSTKHMIKGIHEKTRKKVEQHLQQQFTKRIIEILSEEKSDVLEEMSVKTLKELLHVYDILGEEKEMLEISQILEERKNEGKEKNEASTPSSNKKVFVGQNITLDDLL